MCIKMSPLNSTPQVLFLSIIHEPHDLDCKMSDPDVDMDVSENIATDLDADYQIRDDHFDVETKVRNQCGPRKRDLSQEFHRYASQGPCIQFYRLTN